MDDTNKVFSSLVFSLASKEEKLISVAFMPTSVVSYSGFLCVKSISEDDSRLFSIPLTGYGGTSQIKVLGLPDGEGTGYCLDVDASNETVVYKTITIHNVGCRPAFVKLLITHDGIIQNLSEQQTVINPSEFILMENEKKSVLVSINCMNKNLISNNEVISILYGDEIMRQRLRRKLKSSSSKKKQNLVCNINFNVPYDGEDKVPYDHTYQCPKDESSLFYAHLSKLMIHIFFNGQNTSFSRRSFGALSEVQESFSNLTMNSTMDTRYMTIEGHSPPVKESAFKNISRLSLPTPSDITPLSKPVITDSALTLVSGHLQGLNLGSWTVQPEELIIDTDNKDKRILLKSSSDIDLRFKVDWTVDVITVSPVSGTLPPGGEIGLRLTLINANHNKLLEDYHENIKIFCGGMEKNVHVTVLKDHRKNRGGSPVPPTLNESLRSGFLGDSFYMDSTLVDPVSSFLNVASIFNFPKEIDLQKTRQGVPSETILIVWNPTNFAISWSIHPSTMLFTEPFDDSIDSTSPGIEFLTTNGILKPSNKENIVIKFLPRSIARFSQFFELVLISEGKRQTCNIKVRGDSFADFSTVLQSRSSEVNDENQRAVLKKKVKIEVFADTEVCKFPLTASGQKSTLSITVKNISDISYKLTSIKPKQPFLLKYSTLTLKARRFVTIPVHFKPQRPGCYESEVKFICDNGCELKIKLYGSCSA